MKKKILVSILVLTVLGFSTLAIVLPINSAPIADPDPMLIDSEFRHNKFPIDLSTVPAEEFRAKLAGLNVDAEVGDIKTWLSLDDYNGFYFFTDFELRAVGTYGEVWVQTWEDRYYPEGDPRNEEGAFGYPEITNEQVEYLLDEFDNNIYAKEQAFYGTPDEHTGVNSLLEAWGYVPEGYYGNSEGKTAILISNVRDDAYYDPTYGIYIAGFYSSSLEAYFDRNVMTIDTHDWINRVGPDGTRPYLYEGVFAHEYQHLIHDDFLESDSFINEGFSDYAEYLTGYPPAYGHMSEYMENPTNSLTEWGDQGPLQILADYGAAALFTHWLEDHFPGYQTQYYANLIPNQAGVEQAVTDISGHHWWTFDRLFSTWRLANLLQTHFPGHGLYDYKSVDFDEVSPLAIEEYDGTTFTGASNAYGTTYLRFDERRGNYKMTFDGAEVLNIDWWTETDGGWYSGAQNLFDHAIVAEVSVNSGDTLVFDTYWDIEDFWDFGFVQVSTDGGETWTSLENEYTTYDHDPNAHPTVVANLPGLTGWSGDWVYDMTFDLDAYAGQDVLIGFRYVTDWATLYEGWYVDNVRVGGASVELANVPVEVEYMVSLVQVIENVKRGRSFNLVHWDLKLDPVTQYGTRTLIFFDWRNWDTYYVAVVSPVMNSGTADFTIDLTKKNHRWWW